MSIASSQQSFLRNSLLTLTSTQKPHRNSIPIPIPIPSSSTLTISCNHHSADSARKDGNQLAKLAVVTLAAGLLTLGSVDPASAAKSGGRVGGQAFRPSAPRSSAPRGNNSAPRGNNSRTNIYVNPQVAPPLGGYGYGYGGPFYGGWGWSPFSFFAPGPSVAVGVGGGFDTLTLFLFLGVGAAAAVVRKIFRSRDDEDDDY